MNKVKFTIPKGSLEKATFEILERAWYTLQGQDRTYRPVISDPGIELKLLRPQEIPMHVQEGLHDVGITGIDWIKETRADVEILSDLEYGKVKLVFAVPKSNPAKSTDEFLSSFLRDGGGVRISTEYLNLSSDYLKSRESYKTSFGEMEPLVVTPWWRRGDNDRVSIFLSFGATEAKPPDEADAIIDLTETGATLDQNGLKIIDVMMNSSAVLIANRQALLDEEKREKVFDILTMLKGVVDARKKLHIFLNVREGNLQELLRTLPALKRPTVSPLSEEGWFSVNTVIDKDAFLRLLPTLRRLAQGLVLYDPRQVLPLEEIAKDEAET